MMKKISFAIIGTNFISDKFAEAAKLSKKTELSAVYSRKIDTGTHFASKHGIKKVYTDLSEMLDDRSIDAVYIASPHICHAEQTVMALKSGKGVLCEKMIAADLDGFLLQKAALEEVGGVLLEAMRPDFDPALEIIKKSLPRLGKLRRAVFEYCQYSSRYDRFKSGEVLNAFDPKMKNTALADIGIYPLHVCLNLFGSPRSVRADSVFLHNGFEGMGSIMLSYEGMTANVIYSKITESVNPSVIEGELGSITVDKLNAPTKITLSLRGEESIALDYSPIPNNMLYEIDAFCDMMGGVLSFKPYLAVSEMAMRVVDKVYRLTGADKHFVTDLPPCIPPEN